MSTMSVEKEKKKRAASSPLAGNGKEFKDSQSGSPQLVPPAKSFASVVAATSCVTPLSDGSENAFVAD
jgi:hypothetical protein